MKFTFSWLKKYLETESSLEEICVALTNIGLEVESLEDKSKALSSFLVAKIVSAKNHENSSKLKICQVEVAVDGEANQMLQIICGAANAREGLKVAYAKIGAVIPSNGMVIKKAKIAGVESNGMLCSARELGLGEDSEGIIEIDEKFAIGSKIADIFNQNDAIIEINVTPNRGDCLGVYGIARDLAAAGFGALKEIEINKKSWQFSLPIEIKNSAKEICPFAAFRVIKNVKNCESPKWLKDALALVGINSISAIVDITNYVMLSLNRPMHAYDSSKIEGELNIRLANYGEEFISLKNISYNLRAKDLLIADDKKPLGIAGIIGSASSSCDANTSEILLEAAFFDCVAISTSGRALNILTDARYRFERGVDYKTCVQGIELATKLILEICGDVCEISEIKIIEDKEFTDSKTKIEFDPALIKKRTGVEINAGKACEILRKLEFTCEKISDDKILVTIPSHRSDVEGAQDLVEEVIRIYGYDKIISQKIDFKPNKPKIEIFDKLRLSLVNKGFIENINWSFCDQELAENFAPIKNDLILANPISTELSYMRPNLLIGLLKSCQKNSLRGFYSLSFFEMGRVFLSTEESAQKQMIAGVRIGANKEQNHYNDQREFDIFDVKKDFFNCIEIFGLKPSSLEIISENALSYYHPHRKATVKLGKNIIGYFGEIHPKITKKFDLKNTPNVFEIFLDLLPQSSKGSAKKSFTANDLQIVQRDFAFLIDKNQVIGDLIKTIENCDKKLIKQVDIFDIYSGKNIPVEKKSIALRVLIQPFEATLTSEEIESISKKIITEVVKNYKAELR